MEHTTHNQDQHAGSAIAVSGAGCMATDDTGQIQAASSPLPGQVRGDASLPGKPLLPPIIDEYSVGYQRPPRAGDFKKGQSGNPGGRPKGTKNTKTIIEEVLDRDTCIPGLIDPESGDPLSKHAAMIVAQTRKAEAGDTSAFNALLDRLDGKATQAVEVGNIGEREEFEKKLRAGLTPAQIAAGENIPMKNEDGSE